MIDFQWMEPAQVTNAIVRCGVPATKFKIGYEEELQSHVVTIAKLENVPDPSLCACVFEATFPHFYHVEFEDSAQYEAYRAVYSERLRADGKARAQQWLIDRGLLDTLPQYDPSTFDLSTYVRKIEVYCSVDPGTAIEVVDDSKVTVRNDFFIPNACHAGEKREKLTCVLNAISASNLGDHGVQCVIFSHKALREGESE